MLYYLFEILESQFSFPGASLFSYLSFRAAVSVLISLIVSVIFGKKIINYLKRKQIGESVRELGLDGEDKKEGFYGGKMVEGLKNKRGEKISLQNYAKVKGIQDLDVAAKITGQNLGKIAKSKEVKSSIDYINVFKSNKGNLGVRDYRRKKASNDIALGIFAGIISVALFNRAFNKLLEEKSLN